MTSTFQLQGGASSSLAFYDVSMSASDHLSDDEMAGGSPGLFQQVRDAIDTAEQHRGTREPSSNTERAPTLILVLDSMSALPAPVATSQGPSGGRLTTAQLAALDGLRLQRLILEVNQKTIRVDGAVLGMDSRGRPTAEFPVEEIPIEVIPKRVDPQWIEVVDRTVRVVFVATIFGVAGGALGAFAVGDAVLKEAAKVAVGSLASILHVIMGAGSADLGCGSGRRLMVSGMGGGPAVAPAGGSGSLVGWAGVSQAGQGASRSRVKAAVSSSAQGQCRSSLSRRRRPDLASRAAVCRTR